MGNSNKVFELNSLFFSFIVLGYHITSCFETNMHNYTLFWETFNKRVHLIYCKPTKVHFDRHFHTAAKETCDLLCNLALRVGFSLTPLIHHSGKAFQFWLQILHEEMYSKPQDANVLAQSALCCPELKTQMCFYFNIFTVSSDCFNKSFYFINLCPLNVWMNWLEWAQVFKQSILVCKEKTIDICWGINFCYLKQNIHLNIPQMCNFSKLHNKRAYHLFI